MQAEFHPCYNHVRKPCSPRTWTWHQGAQGGNRTIITDTACVTNSIWEQTLQETIVNTMQLVAGDRQWPYHVHGIYTMCIYVHTLDSPITCMEVWDHHKFTRGPDTLEIGLPSSSPRQMTGSLRPHSGRLGDRCALDCSALCFMITGNIIQNILNLLEI